MAAAQKKRHDDFRALSDDNRHRVCALAAILRLALALDRTHQQNVQEVWAEVANGAVEITVDSQGDANVDLWAAQSKVEFFERVFDREVLFSAKDHTAPQSNRTPNRLGSDDPEEPAENAAANPARPR